MGSQYRLVLKPKDVTGPVSQRLCNADDSLEVRDLTTRTCTTVKMQDISLYRHSVFIDGREFQILNLVRL